MHWRRPAAIAILLAVWAPSVIAQETFGEIRLFEDQPTDFTPHLVPAAQAPADVLAADARKPPQDEGAKVEFEAEAKAATEAGIVEKYLDNGAQYSELSFARFFANRDVPCDPSMMGSFATCGPAGGGSGSGGAGAKAVEKPKYPTVALTGFAQIDAYYWEQDARSDAMQGDLEDYAGFRRARLAARGQVAENVGYMLEMDFAVAGRPSFMDVWTEVQKAPFFGTIRIGQFRQPFSMDALTSVRDLSFLERSTPFQAYDEFRQIGIMAYNYACDDQVTWAYSVYKFPTDVWGNAFGDGGYGFSERVTAAPVYVEQTNQVLHLGGGFLIENPGRFPGTAATNNQFILRSIPEIGFTNGDFFSPGPQNGPFFAQTGLMQNIHYMEGYHLELASSYKSWTFQSEVFAMQISFNDGTSAAFPGAYAQTTYILTGEQKKYVKKSATYSGRIVPKHALGREGWGAWEVAGRWSYIDLSQTPVADAPRSGNMNTITLGLNWYWNANSKMQFNFVRVIQDQTTTNDYAYTNIFGVRTQFDF